MNTAQWWVLGVAGFLLGSALGSFGCVVIDRMPRPLDEPNEFGDEWESRPWREVVAGESRCSSCGTPIRWIDKLPIVSWFLLRGRCRGCQDRIPAFHPAVEFLVPSVAIALVVAMGLEWRSLPAIWLAPVGIVLSAIDLRAQILPTRIVWPSFFVAVGLAVLAAAVEGEWHWLWGGAIGLFLLTAPLVVLWLLLPGSMGFGDVRLAVLLGWVVGFSIYEDRWGVVGFFIAALFLLSAVIGIIMGIGGLMTQGRKAKVPYGPALVIAAFVLLAFHDAIIDGFQLA